MTTSRVKPNSKSARLDAAPSDNRFSAFVSAAPAKELAARSSQTNIEGLGSAVRRHDPDRWRAAQFATAVDRGVLLALLDVDAELASIVKRGREPLLVDIKLAWWAEAVAAAASEALPRRHPVLDRFAAAAAATSADWAMLADVVSGYQDLASVGTGLQDRIAARELPFLAQAAWWWTRAGAPAGSARDVELRRSAGSIWASLHEGRSAADPAALVADALAAWRALQADVRRGSGLSPRVWPFVGMLAGAGVRLTALGLRAGDRGRWRESWDDVRVMALMVRACVRGRV